MVYCADSANALEEAVQRIQAAYEITGRTSEGAAEVVKEVINEMKR